MKKSICISGIVLMFLMVCFLSACTQDYSGEEELTKLTVGVENGLLSAPVFVAENKGYFLEEGLDLTVRGFDSGKLSLQAMLRGDEGIDISSAAPTPIVFSSFDHQDFSIIATFAYSYEDIKVIARKDSGISTAADLKGKKIGATFGTTGQFVTEVFLIHYYISILDVEMIDISPSGLPSALENGQVDAIVVWEPHAGTAISLLGDNAIRLPKSELYKVTFNFAAMNEFAGNNSETIKKFLRAVHKAINFVNNNELEAQEIVSKKLDLSLESVKPHWIDFGFEMSLDHSLILTLEDEARWAIKNNFTESETIPNYLNYIYYDALESILPEVIGMMR